MAKSPIAIVLALAALLASGAALVHQIQRLRHERVMHAPMFEAASIHGVGPRVEAPAIGLSPQLYFAGPTRTCA